MAPKPKPCNVIPIADKYREGKLKSTLRWELTEREIIYGQVQAAMQPVDPFSLARAFPLREGPRVKAGGRPPGRAHTA